MIRGNRQFTTANIAIATALLCGAPAAFAQEAATAPEVQIVAPPPIVQSAPPPTVAPPPMVPTISASPEADRPAPRRSATQAAAKPTSRVRATPVAASEPASVPTPPTSEPTVLNAPVVEDSGLVTATVEDTAPVAPIDSAEPTQLTDATDDDWMIYGGLAAALGLAGLGGVLASRRRRNRVAGEPTIAAPNTAVATPTPRPLPVQQTAAPVERFTAPVAAPVARPSFADQHLPPVTDPLFAHRPVMAPVTDPLFMQTTELPPVTDPMFADRDEYVGNSTQAAAFDKRRDWQPASNDQRKPLHEFEPAE